MKFQVTIRVLLNLVFLNTTFCVVGNGQVTTDIDSEIQAYTTLAETVSDTQSLNKSLKAISQVLINHFNDLENIDSSNAIAIKNNQEIDSILTALLSEIESKDDEKATTIGEFNEAAYKEYVNNKVVNYKSELDAAEIENQKDTSIQKSNLSLDEQMAVVNKVYEENLKRIINKKEIKPEVAKETTVHPFIEFRKDLNQKLQRNVALSQKQTGPEITDEVFENKQGFLKWPLSNSEFLYSYGEQNHKPSNSKFRNQGIDLVSENNNLINCIENGQVMKVLNHDNGTQSIIVKHSSSYISTYSNVKIGNVQTGDNVNAGQVMGICDSADGKFQLHFQIWKADKSQNPRHWLKNK